jgi:hypothetical protein
MTEVVAVQVMVARPAKLLDLIVWALTVRSADTLQSANEMYLRSSSAEAKSTGRSPARATMRSRRCA